MNLQNFLRTFIPKHKKCFLLSFLCALNISCGKKARYPASDDETKRSDEIVSHNKTLTVTDVEPIKTMVASANSIIHIPSKVDILEGVHGGRQVYLSFNIVDYSEFYCIYQGVGSAFTFQDCYQDIDNDGVEEALGMKAGEQIVQAKGKAYELELSFSETAGPIKAQVELDIAEH